MENFSFIFPRSSGNYLHFPKTSFISREKLIIVSFSADKSQKISLVMVVENFMNSSRNEILSMKSLSYATNDKNFHPLTFPGRKFQLHSLPIIALRRLPFSPLTSFRIKTSSCLSPIFTWKKKKKNFSRA